MGVYKSKIPGERIIFELSKEVLDNTPNIKNALKKYPFICILQTNELMEQMCYTQIKIIIKQLHYKLK